jgi:uncharacterized NAD(P)/FAD-binding protein YdhS
VTRLAMIGGGPKTLFALLELHDVLSPELAGALHVDVYDPHPPGAGRVWQSGQPEVLRLNVASRIVDASSRLNDQNFGAWAASNAPVQVTDTYPPRALVGRYLSEQFRTLSEQGNMVLHHVPHAVLGVARDVTGWQVRTAEGAEFYDEVVLATGHGLTDDPSEDVLPTAQNSTPLIGDYGSLTEARIPPGGRVRLRGAALTAYDVALLLTEGRGGRWETDTTDGSGSLRYLASGREPSRIIMTSRTGLPMDPKPESIPPEIVELIGSRAQQLRRWGSDLAAAPETNTHNLDELWRILLDAAADCAAMVGLRISKLQLWRTALTGRSADMRTGDGVEGLWRRSLAVNGGAAEPTTRWVWARVWSGLYAQLVVAIDRVRWEPRQRKLFDRIARNFERMAFGPPERTVQRLVALFEAGLLVQDRSAVAADRHAEIVVDALTPSSGILLKPGGTAKSLLFAGLLEVGEISVRRGERGLLTDLDGTCLNARGQRNESLTALGRPTEGPTLGHDTLNRSLHEEPRRWARRIASQLSLPAPSLSE